MRIPIRYVVIPTLALAACGKPGYREDAASTAPQNADQYVASADSTDFPADITSLTSASRKRVRTADVRCRVTDVFRASTRMEQVVSSVQGIVVESTMKNQYAGQYDLPYTADSLKRMQLYTPTANLTLRVPVASLDSVVTTLTSMAAFIDTRAMRDQDYTLAYLANALKNKRVGQHTAKIVAGKKNTTLDVAQYQDQQEETKVDRSISNLKMLDDVTYATFTVELFQSQAASMETIINPRYVARAGFGTELRTAIVDGANLLRDLLLFFVQIWPLLIMAVLGWWGYKRYRRMSVK
ncbi:DUF4349 domain-containing protein [Chitinophaga qingshengii]|uniref:DUF4349 domain-containing protein n=1 Tax=Chitinophaga qingshengii TaxID=1569794 RepID=A0ABR7TUT8_9BACT|nr:DUF4349 domain-containing protein [Chitinophaga qingshengii]MBC9934252.1 DUF4349 domain-containing protein [Chitinophaga qingshengii]